MQNGTLEAALQVFKQLNIGAYDTVILLMYIKKEKRAGPQPICRQILVLAVSVIGKRQKHKSFPMDEQNVTLHAMRYYLAVKTNQR